MNAHAETIMAAADRSITNEAPGGRPLTAEQRRALEAMVNVALSSGAGCGKTTVLTSRFLSALERRAALSGLVAVTFTEKAASELRSRIRTECRRRLAEGGPDSRHWRQVLRGLEAGRIGTFHSFCLDLLRRFPVQAGLPPEFSVLEEAVAPTLRDDALRACIRRWLSIGHEDLVALAVELGLDAVRLGLRNLLLGRALADPDRWARRSPDALVDQWRQCWESEARPALLREFVEKARPCLDLLATVECRHPTGAERRAALLTEIPLLPEAPDPFLSLDLIRECAKVQGGGGASHWPSSDLYDQIKKYYQDLRSAVDQLRKNLEWDEEITRRSAEHGVRFARLAREALDEVERAKRMAEHADFDDLLVCARSLLIDAGPDLLGSLRSEIDLMMVDEFQDTDPIQGAIVQALAGDDPTASRLFLVGDSKQSIYRFRGAEPRIFDQFREALPETGRLSLTGNFRSVPGVIHFVNALFCDDLYPDPSAALRPRDGLPEQEASPVVEFLWARDSNPRSTKSAAHDRRRLEARWLARLLADRLEDGWPIRDPKDGTLRQARASDIALLFRALTSAAPYEQAMAEQGLDYHTVDGSAFYAQQEVLDVVNLLSAIEDPLDPLALAASLRGPFFCLSDDGLYWLANARPEDRPSDLIQNLQRCESIASCTRVDRRRAVRARDLLDRWRSLKDRVPIARLLERVLDESGYEAALVAEPLGDRKRANVRKLVRLASRYDRSGYALADYTARLRADQRQLAREDQAATNTEQGDAVRLMSIHRAKGLEFPIVVLPDLDRKPRLDTPSVVIDERFGPIVRAEGEPGSSDDVASPWSSTSRPQSLGALLRNAHEQREERAEALRLFYVGTTRAISHLILSAGIDCEPEDIKPTSPAMELLARRFDLASGSLTNALPERWPSPRIGVISEPPARRSPRTEASPRRVKPVEVVRTIVRARPDPTIDRETPAHRSTWVVLDPTRNLSPRAARVDGLIRGVLGDRKAAWVTDLEAALERAARSTVPVSSRRVIAEALQILKPWVAGPLARRIASAIERRIATPWVLTVPVEEGGSIVYRGAIDLAFREDRAWRIATISHPEEPLEHALERLRLSALAAGPLDFGPISGGWLVRLDRPPEGHRDRYFEDRKHEQTTDRMTGTDLQTFLSSRSRERMP